MRTVLSSLGFLNLNLRTYDSRGYNTGHEYEPLGKPMWLILYTVHRPQEYTVMTGECPGGLRVFNGYELSVHIRLLLRRTPVQ